MKKKTQLNGMTFYVTREPRIYQYGEELKQTQLTSYYYVSPYNEDEQRTQLIPVHRIVAKAYCKIPDGYEASELQVDHIDGDRKNNSPENLRWVTRRDNNSTLRARKLKSVNHQHNSHKGQVLLYENRNVVYANLNHAAKCLHLTRQSIIQSMHNIEEGRSAKRMFRWISEDEARQDFDLKKVGKYRDRMQLKRHKNSRHSRKGGMDHE